MDVGRLRQIGVFADMSETDLRRIAAFATEDSAPEGSTLIREGDYSTELIAIEEGTAEVLHDGRRVATLGPGDVCGETGVLERGLRNASVLATSPVRIVRLTTWDIKRLTPETVGKLRDLVVQRRPAVEQESSSPPAA